MRHPLGAMAAVCLATAACSSSPGGNGAPPITAPTRDVHDAWFPISAGPHAVDCNACHGGAQSFKQFDCLGCHAPQPTAQGHARVDGFRYASDGCFSCHQRGTATFSHVAFPVAAGDTHALGRPVSLGNVTGAIACSTCHTDQNDFRAADCTGCHTEGSMADASGRAFHAAVPDLPPQFSPGPQTSAACILCHADGKVPAAVASTKAPVHDQAFGFAIAPGSHHAGQACLTCHSQTAVAGPAAVLTADFKQQTCTACHARGGTLRQDCDALHVGIGAVGGFRYVALSSPPMPSDSKTCLNCHRAGAIEGFDHSRWFPIGPADPHALGKIAATSSGPVTQACATCHQDPARRQDVSCTSCHSAAGGNAEPPAAIDLGPAHAAKVAGQIWHAAPDSQCLLCHAGGALDRVAAHGRTSAFPIDGGNHFVACDQCHTALAAGDTDLKNPRIDFNQRSCDSCHSEAKDKLVTVHAGIGLTIEDPSGPNNAAACLSCHPDGRAAAASTPGFTHAFFPVLAGTHALGTPAVHASGNFSCASCHTALTTDPAQIDCTSCHAKAQMTTAAGVSFHASVPDLKWPSPATPQATSLQCLQCHADSKVPAQVAFSSTSNKGKHDSTNAKIVFDVTRGSPHDTADASNMTCSTCHSVRSAPFGSMPAFTVTDFAQQTCTSCHLATGTLHQDLNAIHAGITTPPPGFTPVPAAVTPEYSKTCLTCHANGRVDVAGAAANHVDFFPIAMGDTHALGKVLSTSAGNVLVACSTCHQDPAHRENVTCTACHSPTGTNAAGPPAIDLAPAHLTKVAGTSWQAAATPTPQCLTCHAKDALERVSTHGRASDRSGVIFDISSGDHFVACDRCHTVQVTDLTLKNPRIDFNQRSCESCHSEAKDRLVTVHAGIGLTIQDPSGSNNAPACLSCHPDGKAAPATTPGFSHSFFPVDAGSTHQLGAPAILASGEFKCASCHTALANDPSRIDCTGCHTEQQMTDTNVAPFHVSVPDLVWPSPADPQATSLKCLLCHADSKVPAQVSYSASSVKGWHAPANPGIGFDVTEGAPHATADPGRPMACLTCHSVATSPFPGIAAFAVADFAQQTCTACHSAAGTLHQDLNALHVAATTPSPGFIPVPAVITSAYSKTCLPCHANGRVDPANAAANHVRFFPISAGDSHALGKAVATSSGPAVVACATCHQDPAARQNVTCTTCHSPAGTSAAPPAAVDLVPAHAGKVAGTSWTAVATPTPQCVACHAKDFLERVSVHGTGAGSDHPGVAFAISSGPHFVACDRCHTALVANDPDLANPRIDFNQRSCDGCHAEAKDKVVSVHRAIGLTIQDPSGPNNARACLACHPDGGSAPNSTPGFTHAFFPVLAGSTHALGTPAVHAGGNFACGSCHTAMSAEPSRVDCTGCHTEQQMTTSAGASFHAAVPDLQWPSPADPQATSWQCLGCHADSKVPAEVSFSTASNKGRHDPTNAAIVFDVTAGAPHATGSADRSMPCLTCHPAKTTPFGGIPAFVRADFAQQACTACHLSTGTLHQDLDAVHAGVTTPPPGFTPVPAVVTTEYSKTCLPCHADGRVDPEVAAANHAASFPIAATDSHAYGKTVMVAGQARSITCASCHVETDHRPNVDCTGCHVPSVDDAPGLTTPVDQTTAHWTKVGLTDANGQPHNLWLGRGPVGDGSGESARCVLCHAGDQNHAGLVATHGAGSDATGHAVFDIAPSNEAHFVSCDVCHVATVTGLGRSNPGGDFNRAACDACHLPSGPESILAAHAAFGAAITAPYQAGDANNSAACLGCHPNGGTQAGFAHAWFPIATGDKHNTSVAKCADCHATQASYQGDPTANLALITCTRCHDDDPANVQNQGGVTTTQAHSAGRVGRDIWDLATPGKMDYASNALCLKCHAGNIGDAVAAWSTPLVFRLTQHDAHCRIAEQGLVSGDGAHHVDQHARNGVAICFACHDFTVDTGSTPWAVNWGHASGATSCTACHAQAQRDYLCR